MLHVLFAASEAVPFAKAGGLGDVIGSLPFAFDKDEVDARVILPKYGAIPEVYKDDMREVARFSILLGWRNQYCGVLEMEHKGITFYFIDNEFYFGSNKIYSYIHEDVERFSFFSKAVLSVLPSLNFHPDIIHCNDWETALIPVFLRAQFQDNPFYDGIKTVLTVHNLKFQGIYDMGLIKDITGLPDKYFTYETMEFHGNANLLKGGLIFADYITTVSPTYAHEIQTPYYGEGLDFLLRLRKENLCGILNGIDEKEYSPSTDRFIYKKYGPKSFLAGKKANKLALQKELNLTVSDSLFMIGMVSRLTDQKGLDLIANLGGDTQVHRRNTQLVVLGTGEKKYEDMFRYMQEKDPGMVSVTISFDEGLAHKIYAGCDAFLMPSLFEPCGLSQLMAMRYGTVPIVRETGGLADTVEPFNEFANTGTGFSFKLYDAYDMLHIISYAHKIFDESADLWHGIMQRGMRQDFTWKQSAQKYLELYRSLRD